MAYSSIAKPGDYFNTVLYSGNGSTNAITGVGFQPDWLWVKCRSNGNGHQLFDVLRTTYSISTNVNDAQANRASDGFTSLDSDGFTMNGSGSGGNTNVSGRTYVGWNWRAGGSGSSNSNGSVTSTVSANTTAGFSVCKFTYPSSGNFTFGHGLGVAPKMFILKGLGTANWQVYHEVLGNTKNIQLNYATTANSAANWWGSTSPTSTVCTVGADLIESGQDAIAYCFAEKRGYSKFGKYTGNGNADGPFVYTGFKPAWMMFKPDASADWTMVDAKRNTFNPVADKTLNANLDSVEHDGSADLDFYSNGFKIKNANTDTNNSGTIIYWAFAENPFVGNDSGTAVPVTAR
tara:strand:- start:12 stop:1052 length:1041 start_codon:yes stop_codon:yes gene_type:complete